VAVTSDHGESFGQHNQRIHSFSVYESAVHVPLVLLHPELREEQPPRIADVAGHIDVAPTLLAALRSAGFQPAQIGEVGAVDDSLEACATDRRIYFFATGNQVILGLRDGPFKYHYHLSTGHEELFELPSDPGEMHNLAAEQPDRCATYKRKLGGFVSYQRRFMAEHRAK
jgi:arylsulfatase A-like enzyme